jgi:hypothetical protein
MSPVQGVFVLVAVLLALFWLTKLIRAAVLGHLTIKRVREYILNIIDSLFGAG